ncbi:sodium hydrogen exchanger 9B2 isoform X1 [Pelobates cultripes]|uniref:Sodium hydrogen exchanger 9B2 isoform X1 n=2 Tax=Pelobates cultripes TaxID=61616 RepID=A0AAD1SLS8_PELCU|nr:sodium hydrogen exchanger 9B2 isoform X1 [Pelobates cultripes]
MSEEDTRGNTMENKEIFHENYNSGQEQVATSESQPSDVSSTGNIVKDGAFVNPKVQDGNFPTEESALLNSGQQSAEVRAESTMCMKMKKLFACPPQGPLSLIITNVTMIALVWCVIWSITGAECLPGGNLFGILALFFCAFFGGKLVGLIKLPTLPPMPPLLGMLLAGFLIRNIPWVTDLVQIKYKWSAALRNIALAIILIRAGLGLDPMALKKLKAVCLRLSLGPCAIEACSAALLSHFLLGLPITWAFMLGFVLGAVSPAVVVPSMLILQHGGFGVEKGVPTLLMAAGSFDDILAITGFNTCLGMAFSSGSTINSIVRGVLEVVVGISAGLLLGFFLHYFPSKDQGNLKWKRTYIVLALAIFAVFGSLTFGFPGSGGLCTLVMAFLAGIGWSANKTVVEDAISVAWDIFQPLLFGLIGAEISVASLKPETVGLCVATLVISLAIRVCATYLMVCCAGFNLKEKIFISLAWIPKATVQAAIGSVALDTARTNGKLEYEEFGMDVLTAAFLSILITAPIGAVIIGLTGPKMLQKATDEDKEQRTTIGESIIV